MKFFRKKKILSPGEKKELRKYRLWGALSGLLLGVSFPPFPFPFTLLVFFALVPYFFVLEKKEKLAEVNRFTYITFFVFNLITIYWVGSWTKEADPFLMIGGFLLLFLNTSFFLIPSTLYYFASRVFGRNTAIWLFPFFWVSYEYMYMLTDASFPWLTLGNGMSHFNKFIQIADTIGALGLSLIAVYVNVLIYIALRKYFTEKKINYTASACSILLVALPVAYGFYTASAYTPSPDKIKVAMIQPNLDPWEKWNNSDIMSLAREYIHLSEQAVKTSGAEVVFWPETALPVYLRDGSYQRVIDTIYSFIKRNNVYLVTGMPDFVFYSDVNAAPSDAKKSRNGNYSYATYNSVLLLSPYTNQIERYGKMKLVPFGERVPFVDALPFLGDFIKWNVGISGWNVGRDTLVFSLANISRSKGSEVHDSVKINSLVCFESVYPAFVAAFTQKGAQLISVVTNDSWYGNSSGPYQHKEIGVLRAVENRRTVVRAANGGISTIIDPLGRTIAETKMFTRTFLTGEVSLEKHLTFFSKHPLLIPNSSLIVSLLTTLLFIFYRIKRLF